MGMMQKAPLNWVRWKVVIGLGVVGGLIYFIGLNPFARWQINYLGDSERGANWSVQEVGLGLLAGDVDFFELAVAAARVAEKAAEAASDGSKKEKVFNADEVKCELSVTELSRRRFVIDQMGLVRPHMDVRRRQDGSSNLGDLEDEGVQWPDAEKAKDWVRTAKEWYKKLEKYKDKLPKGDEDPEKERERQKEFNFWERKVEYPFAERPSYLIHRIFAEELEIAFADEGADEGEKIPNLTNGVLEITGLSSNPAAHTDPIALTLEGDLGGSSVEFTTSVDFTGDLSKYVVSFAAPNLDVSVVSAFIGESLPVSLASGKIGVGAKIELYGNEGLKIVPELAFQDVKLAEKPGEDKVAGIDAKQFISAFNEASDALGGERLNIADLKITGSLSSPKFEWGNTVTDLVKQGGRAFANKQIEKGKSLLKEEAGKHLDKATDILNKELDKTGVGDAVKKGLEGVIPGGVLPGGSKDGDKKGSDEKKDVSAADKAINSGVDKIKGLIPGLGGGKKD